MKTVITLTGVKQSGKSTSSDFIKKMLVGYDVKESALADKLKDVCAEVFNMERVSFDSQQYKEIPFKIFRIQKTLTTENVKSILNSFGIDYLDHLQHLRNLQENGIIGMNFESPRHIAQIVGTEILRGVGDPDIHCKFVNLSHDVTIISDSRFVNEFKYFKNLPDIKFIPLYIKRDSAENFDHSKAHVSETDLFNFCDQCVKIDNNGDFEDLESQINEIIGHTVYSDSYRNL
jgi:hypothetical protein